MKLSDLTREKKKEIRRCNFGMGASLETGENIGFNSALDLPVDEELLKENGWVKKNEYMHLTAIEKWAIVNGYINPKEIDEVGLHNCICGDVPHSIDACEQAQKIVKAIKDYLCKEN